MPGWHQSFVSIVLGGGSVGFTYDQSGVNSLHVACVLNKVVFKVVLCFVDILHYWRRGETKNNTKVWINACGLQMWYLTRELCVETFVLGGFKSAKNKENSGFAVAVLCA